MERNVEFIAGVGVEWRFEGRVLVNWSIIDADEAGMRHLLIGNLPAGGNLPASGTAGS